MKIREISRHVDFASVVKRKDLSKPALDILALAISRGDVDRFLQRDGNLDEYSRAGMLGLLELRSKNLEAQGREFHGFNKALAAVNRLEDTERVSWMAIPSLAYLLVLLINVTSYDVIGCMSLKRIAKERPKVPPGWDGSKLE
ncbi:hypothetical protein [Burkholderia vietnamiensis]|jgi:hypothetical protein|uniref:hypothetical protein n=1 Tax=Burkholderia vietnamiensis TaxID=60552 RepID=UPI0012D9AEB3|nr:hypothetical protein [Burkholderia vietnamiensis]CAG9195197.1 conserved hypothetical protein [Burkholderia vietnamiensis]HDR8968398.1 hypothetical protein [Burkholderia vietnamiensis]